MEQQTQQPIQEKTQSKPTIKTNRKFIAVFLFLSIVAAGVVGYYFLTQKPEGQKVEKVVYTKAAWDGDVGRVRRLIVANRDGTGRKFLLEKMPNEYPGISASILLVPERNEVVIVTQGGFYPYDIDVEKIHTETGQRTKLAIYKEGGIHGMSLLSVILSPDKKKIALTIRKHLFIVDITKEKLVALKPFYTDTQSLGEESIAPAFWDLYGNIYLKSFEGRPEENRINDFIKVSSQGKREELSPEQKAFFRAPSSESQAVDFHLYPSPDGEFAAWIISSKEDTLSQKILVYSVEERWWFIRLKKDSIQTLENEEAINFQKEKLDSPLHNVEIKGGSKEDIGGAQLYIDGVLVDSIRRISVGFGHGEAFEILGFVKGFPTKGVEKDIEEERWEKIQQLRQSLLYPAYLPDGWKEDEKLGDEIGVNTDFQGMTLYFAKGEKGIFSINQRRSTDITGDEGKPRIPEFILEDVSSGRQPIDLQESVAIDGREGIYITTYNKTTQYIIWSAEGFDVYIACETFNDCRFSKSELLAIASSMVFPGNRGQNDDFVSSSDWQTYRNEQLGFEIKYPPDLNDLQSPALGGVRFQTKRDVYDQWLYRFTGGVDPCEMDPTIRKYFTVEKGRNIGGVEFSRYEETQTSGYLLATILYMGEYGDLCYRLYYIQYGERDNRTLSQVATNTSLFEQIVSTFRFTSTPKPISARVAREITITAKKNQWRFIPEEFEVNQGDRVVLTVVNEDDYDHGFAIDQFGISQRIAANGISKVEFVTTQAGDFPFYSSVPSGGGIVDGEKRTYYDMVGEIHVRSLIQEAK